MLVYERAQLAQARDRAPPMPAPWKSDGKAQTVRAGLGRSPRAAGEPIATSEIEHIPPLAHQHIHLYGHYPFDLASRPDGHRPLRTAAMPATPAPKTLNRV